MNFNSSMGKPMMGTGTTKISERMTWKQLQQCLREKNDDFSKLLAQNFLLLHHQAKEKKDSISLLTLDVIVAGFMDLEKVTEERIAAKASTPEFSTAAYTLFFRLAEAYNNPSLLKQAGLYCMTEWRLPEAAVRYFERALSLGGPEQSIRPLLDVATLAVEHKVTGKKGFAVEKGQTSPVSAKAKLTQMLRQTSKLLIAKTQRPSPQASFVMGRNLKSKPTAVLPDPIKECLKEAARELAEGNLSAVHALLVRAGKYPVKKEILCGMWSNLGRAWYQAGDSVQMEEAYTQAYLHDPKGSNTYFNLALAKSLNKKIAEAESLYQMAGKLDPSNPKTWCNLGVLYFQNDRFKEAEEAFRTAIEHRADYARAWGQSGIDSVGAGQGG